MHRPVPRRARRPACPARGRGRTSRSLRRASARHETLCRRAGCRDRCRPARCQPACRPRASPPTSGRGRRSRSRARAHRAEWVLRRPARYRDDPDRDRRRAPCGLRQDHPPRAARAARRGCRPTHMRRRGHEVSARVVRRRCPSLGRTNGPPSGRTRARHGRSESAPRPRPAPGMSAHPAAKLRGPGQAAPPAAARRGPVRHPPGRWRAKSRRRAGGWQPCPRW